MSTATDTKTGKISVRDITEDQLEQLAHLAEEEASKPRLPQKFIDILEMNYSVCRDVVDNRGYKSLQRILLESLNIDVSIHTLRQYMSELKKKSPEDLAESSQKKSKKKRKAARKQVETANPVGEDSPQEITETVNEISRDTSDNKEESMSYRPQLPRNRGRNFVKPLGRR